MSDVNDLRAQRDDLDRRITEAETEQPPASTIEVTVTARELLDRHLWDRACDLTGLNPWAINEGMMDSGERMTFTLEQAREMGLLRDRGEAW